MRLADWCRKTSENLGVIMEKRDGDAQYFPVECICLARQRMAVPVSAMDEKGSCYLGVL